MEAWLEAQRPRLEAAVSTFVNDHSAPGAAVGAVVDGALAWHSGHGFADLMAARPPDAHTGFRVASVTKTFTATALMQLRDEAAIDLDDPLAAHLPEFAGARNPFGPVEDVTLRLLLTHRAGITGQPPLQDWRARRFPSVQETLAAADRIEVVVPPGTERKYSNLGYQLLGEVVARADGRPYRDAIGARLLLPLGLDETGFDPPDGIALATGYDAPGSSDEPPVSAGREKPTDAEGGLWSTAHDMARWLAFQLEGDVAVLSTESLREMQRPSVLTDEGWTGGQGLGWTQERRGERVYVGHQGSTVGFSARVAFSPADRIGVAVLANGEAPASALALSLMDQLVDASRAHPRVVPLARPLPLPEAYRDLVGSYAWADGGDAFRVEWRGGALAVVWVGAELPRSTLEPTDEPDAFVIRGGNQTGERATFHRGPDGTVVGLDFASFPLDRLA
jgi:CubicO group peptidase (beta-lactamase class C family)